MLHWNVRLMFYFTWALKNVQKCEGKDVFYPLLNDSFDSAIKGCTWDTPESATNDALSNLHKDAQEGAFEVALKGALEVALGLHL